MLCDLCHKRKATRKYEGEAEIELQICDVCHDFMFKKNIRNHYGGQLYEYINQLKKIRETQNPPKRYKVKKKQNKVFA